MDTYFAFTFIDNLVSYPSLSRLAWVQTDRGVANIWVAEGPDYEATQCTKFTLDENLNLNTVLFSTDGDYIWFNAQLSDNANAAGEIFPRQPTYYYTDFSCTQLEAGPAGMLVQAVSPKGATVKDSSNVYEVTTTDGSSTTLFSYNAGFESPSDFSWSPDGNTLVFTSYRGDHNVIGLWQRNSQFIQYLAPSFEQDATPVWSPDGSMVAWLRFYEHDQPNARPILTEFFIVVYEIATGDSAIIYTDDTVGWAETYGFGERQMVWFDDKTIIFPCETSGWLHVCSVLLDGTVTELVNGDCEVQDYITTEDYIYVSHNCDNIDTLSIAQIDMSDMTNVSLYQWDLNVVGGMSDQGYGMAQVGADGLAYIRSTWNMSTHVVVWSENDPDSLNIISKNMPYSAPLVVPQNHIWPAIDESDFEIHSQVFLPPDFDSSSTYPAVVFTHGGPMRQMYNAFHYCIDYAQLYAENQHFANNGFVVISVNYRMGVGYGKLFRDCPNCGMWGAAEYNDVLGGALYLKSFDWINPSSIGIYGLSYGGLNTLQALGRNPDVFSAGVANAPVYNWITEGRFDGDPYFTYNPTLPDNLAYGPEANLATDQWTSLVDENIRAAYWSSPIAYISNYSCPVLVIQGDSDANVDVQESIGLIHSLGSLNKPVTSMMFPNERHGLGLYSNELIVATATYEWMVSQLM
eukprot:TRINITY_DN3142_c0_g1_i1.p1 TRINITY_DN3142_c0_g1~~TRINITY_DN3142_c0_g1_i1.p1  ORF type:complete len:763 (+),score=142.71 TRINITY_DN3142_c0_g1_i1:231-2291(+)